MVKKILALSSSRVGNSEYLETALPLVKDFLGERSFKIAFVPFASVNGYDDYFLKVTTAFESFSHEFNLITAGKMRELIDADVIMIGGGNTFKLLHDLYDTGMLNTIREKVNSGTPFIGWSAGSNILSPTLCTTNDMPIIEPKSFKALNLFRFQINPHYFNVTIDGFNGETRDQRLLEFTKINPGSPVVGLPEGTALLQEAGTLKFLGNETGVLLEGTNIRKIHPAEDLTFLL